MTVRPRSTRTPMLSRLAVGVSVSVALVIGFGIAGPAAFAADGPCVGDTCDDGAWRAARGEFNEKSYWWMSPGHNCTNYVAWRLINDGIAKPATQPGNAADWATNAIADGYRVDDVPIVGSVAQWGSFAFGYGELGHVAYVEKVNGDGTILVSEDSWGGGAQVGPLTYRTVDVSKVSDFIHYADESTWLRTSALEGDAWVTTGTHLDVETRALVTLPREDGAADVVFAHGGTLWQASPGPTGWTTTDLGVTSNAESLSATTMFGTRPYLMSIDKGELVMTVRTDFSWQRMPTGLPAEGDLAAVNLGGLLPTVFVSTGGRLWVMWGDTEGWHATVTGVPIEGPIEAVVDSAGRPVIFSVDDGELMRTWFDREAWHSESTGIVATGQLEASWTQTGPEVYFVDDGTVSVARTDGIVWTSTTLGIAAGEWLEVLETGAASPFIALLG